ncbi:MAG: glycosyltransferase [Candidatus Kapaibacterium sp.]
MKISLSAAIIAKDAQEGIARAIESVRPFADEIIVVDTGSADATPRIATRCGAEVHYFEWTGSFAEARNYSLGLCRGEWILAIDTDEELDESSFCKYMYLMKDSSLAGINLRIRNPLGKNNGAAVTSHRYTRLFRNYPGIRYEGRIHEQIRESIERAGGRIAEAEIIIHHYGYADNPPEKAARNREMLRREIEESPEDSWNIYNLAETEFSAGHFDEAHGLFVEVYDNPQLTPVQREMSRVRLAQIELKADNFAESEKWLDFSCESGDMEGFRKFVLAAVRLNTRRFAEALELYESPEVTASELVDRSQLAAAIGVAGRAVARGLI